MNPRLATGSVSKLCRASLGLDGRGARPQHGPFPTRTSPDALITNDASAPFLPAIASAHRIFGEPPAADDHHHASTSAEMGRALRNLVTNAIRHTPPDGGVDVLAEVQSGMACVSVSDACGGIPPGDLPRVFDVAFRGESARTPGPQEGAGLGLSIARGIVEAHSGEIAVRNAGPGCQFLIRPPPARPGVPAINRTVPRRPVGGPPPAGPDQPRPDQPRAITTHSTAFALPGPRLRRGPAVTAGGAPGARLGCRARTRSGRSQQGEDGGKEVPEHIQQLFRGARPPWGPWQALVFHVVLVAYSRMPWARSCPAWTGSCPGRPHPP